MFSKDPFKPKEESKKDLDLKDARDRILDYLEKNYTGDLNLEKAEYGKLISAVLLLKDDQESRVMLKGIISDYREELYSKECNNNSNIITEVEKRELEKFKEVALELVSGDILKADKLCKEVAEFIKELEGKFRERQSSLNLENFEGQVEATSWKYREDFYSEKSALVSTDIQERAKLFLTRLVEDYGIVPSTKDSIVSEGFLKDLDNQYIGFIKKEITSQNSLTAEWASSGIPLDQIHKLQKLFCDTIQGLDDYFHSYTNEGSIKFFVLSDENSDLVINLARELKKAVDYEQNPYVNPKVVRSEVVLPIHSQEKLDFRVKEDNAETERRSGEGEKLQKKLKAQIVTVDLSGFDFEVKGGQESKAETGSVLGAGEETYITGSLELNSVEKLKAEATKKEELKIGINLEEFYADLERRGFEVLGKKIEANLDTYKKEKLPNNDEINKILAKSIDEFSAYLKPQDGVGIVYILQNLEKKNEEDESLNKQVKLDLREAIKEVFSKKSMSKEGVTTPIAHDSLMIRKFFELYVGDYLKYGSQVTELFSSSNLDKGKLFETIINASWRIRESAGIKKASYFLLRLNQVLGESFKEGVKDYSPFSSEKYDFYLSQEFNKTLQINALYNRKMHIPGRSGALNFDELLDSTDGTTKENLGATLSALTVDGKVVSDSDKAFFINMLIFGADAKDLTPEKRVELRNALSGIVNKEGVCIFSDEKLNLIYKEPVKTVAVKTKAEIITEIKSIADLLLRSSEELEVLFKNTSNYEEFKKVAESLVESLMKNEYSSTNISKSGAAQKLFSSIKQNLINSTDLADLKENLWKNFEENSRKFVITQKYKEGVPFTLVEGVYHVVVDSYLQVVIKGETPSENITFSQQILNDNQLDKLYEYMRVEENRGKLLKFLKEISAIKGAKIKKILNLD